MHRISGFPPVSSRSARVLILGSMPGVASLEAQRYYAHPYNQFWPIMGALLGFDPAVAYEARCMRLKEAGVALWDVLQSCIRPGSLDSDIVPASTVPNDFAGFLATHPHIRRVCFNGSTAETLFRRHVRPSLSTGGIGYARLPSTSPAHAGMRPEEKFAVWRSALDGHLQPPA